MNIWRKALGTTDRALDLGSNFGSPTSDYWHWTITVAQKQANERLKSIRLLLLNDCVESPNIVVRSLFELAVNLVYISKDIPTRLDLYLTHGGVRQPPEDQATTIRHAERLRQELIAGTRPHLTGLVQTRPWRRLSDMCREMGSPWLDDYETFYPVVSETVHASSRALPDNMLQLLDQHAPSQHSKAVCLVTALAFHLNVLEIAAGVFPEQIQPPKFLELKREVGMLGQSLASRTRSDAQRGE